MKIISLAVGFLPTNCYILCDEASREAAVIDPGFEGERILSELAKTGCKARYVLLTHGHFDHVTSAAAVLSATGAKLVAHEDETALLSDETLSLSNSSMNPLRTPFIPLKPDILIRDGDTLTLGGLTLKFLHTPGHTRGGCCIICEDVIFTGDTIFRCSVGRTDMPTGNSSAILRSARKIAMLPGDYRLYPGHGETTTLAEEREQNFYMS